MVLLSRLGLELRLGLGIGLAVSWLKIVGLGLGLAARILSHETATLPRGQCKRSKGFRSNKKVEKHCCML